MSRPTLMISCLATALLTVAAWPAQAYLLRLVNVTPGYKPIGDLVVFEVYLDTEGQSGITLFSVSMTFNPTVAQYRPDLSATNSYFPLYAPGVAKVSQATWLSPIPFDGDHCSSAQPLCSNPPQLWTGNQPGIGGQVNVDFIETNLNDTVATATNLLLARLTFEMVGSGVSVGEWSFDYGGNVFSVGGVDVSDQRETVVAVGSAVFPIPEPTTALLVAVGLLGLALRRRGR